MRQFRVIKTILYMLAGLAVLVLNEVIMESHFVGIVVAIVVLSYALDVVIISIISRKLLDTEDFFTAIVHVLLTVVLFSVYNDIVKVCLVWAVWSIIREGKEAAESLHRVLHKKAGLLNIVESIVIVVFSFMMILDPGEHHAHIHIVILGIELMLEAVFPLMNDWLDAAGKIPGTSVYLFNKEHKEALDKTNEKEKNSKE